MNNMTIQAAASTAVKNLMRTDEFRDVIEIVKGLLFLTYVDECHNNVYKEARLNNSLFSLSKIPREIFNRPKVDNTIIQSDESFNLLLEAYSSMNLSTSKDRIAFSNALISFTAISIGKMHWNIAPAKLEVSRLIGFIASEIGMEDVFDPYAAAATYAITPEFDGISFSGYEISPDASAIGNLLLAINGRKMSIETVDFVQEYTKTCLPEGLISIPPFGMRIKDDVSGPISSRYAEEFIIEQFVEDGTTEKAIIVVPMRLAFSNSSEWLRKLLVNRDMIDMSISMPSGLLNGTNIPSMMLVLDKNKPEDRQDKITFISLLDCVIPYGKSQVTIELEKAKEIVSKRIGKYVTTLDLGQIDNVKTDINPGRYLTHNCVSVDSNEYRIVPVCVNLSHIEAESKHVRLGETKNVVGLSDLGDEYNFATISSSPKSKTSSTYYEIDKDAIIIGRSNNSLKVGKFLASGKPMCISGVLSAYQLWPLIDSDYILMELTKPYVSEQISLLNIPPILHRDNVDYIVRNTYIAVAEISSQRHIVKEAKDAYLASLHLDIASIQTDYRKDVHMKRHAMGQTIASIGSWWTLLEQVRTKDAAINEQSKLDGLDITLGTILDNIKTCFGRLSTQIDKFDRGYNSKPEIVRLSRFFEEYISSHQSPVFEYDYSVAYSSQNEKLDDEGCSIYFPKDVLTMIVNNIISNAAAHGFDNEPRKGNAVRVSIMEYDGICQVSISNNGKPCPPDMTPDKMVTYGESTDLKKHCGIGGYETKQLMNDFGGKLDIVLDSLSDFPVEYILTFNSVDNEKN